MVDKPNVRNIDNSIFALNVLNMKLDKCGGANNNLFISTRCTCTGLQEKKRKIESTTLYKYTTYIK